MKIITRTHYRPELTSYWAVTAEHIAADRDPERLADMAEAAITDAMVTGSVGATREEAGAGGVVYASVTVRRIEAVVLAVPYGADAEPPVKVAA